MVRIELLELTENLVSYKYFPEDSKEYGIVSLDRKTGEKSVKKVAEKYSSSYAAHAICRMEEYLENEKFPETDIVAWY